MITRWINEISKTIDPISNKVTYNITGDGHGDFEDRDLSTTIECINEYLAYLKSQENLAQELRVIYENEKLESNHDVARKTLQSLSRNEFEILKKSGMLWEFYPDAPEFFYQIKPIPTT